ncbi:MAG: dockerin type I repeat-containing protein [Prevotella sp.]|nr:dockerin type I repeat-containing protein [Prevotella sp.]
MNNSFLLKKYNILKAWLLVFALACATSIQAAGLRGDVDGNGSVSVNDVMLLVGYIVGEEQGVPLATADINDDGNVSVADVLMLVEIILEGEAGPIGDGGGAKPDYPVLTPIK